MGNKAIEHELPIRLSSPSPSNLKPTTSIQAWANKATVSNGFLSCGSASAGRLNNIYLDKDKELNMFPMLIDIV